MRGAGSLSDCTYQHFCTFFRRNADGQVPEESFVNAGAFKLKPTESTPASLITLPLSMRSGMKP